MAKSFPRFMIRVVMCHSQTRRTRSSMALTAPGTRACLRMLQSPRCARQHRGQRLQREDYGVWYVVALRYGLLTLISQVYVRIRLTLPYFQSADPVESRKGGSCYRSFRFSFLEWQLAGSCLHFQIQAESVLACSLSARARANFERKQTISV